MSEGWKYVKAAAIAEPVREVVFADDDGKLKSWLEEQARAYGLTYLLAHADDGVFWGRIGKEGLTTSDQVAPDISPLLRANTLQQARLFGKTAELLLWRENEEQFLVRLIQDASTGQGIWEEAMEEKQMLWGDHATPLSNDFTLLEEGAQGLRHVVPLKLIEGDFKPENGPRLIVRHYITKDGFARIVASRLVTVEGEQK
jgi:CRISPR-associated protein (TIGR03984 family)